MKVTRQQDAYSLIELITAAAILAMLALLMVQITNTASNTIQLSDRAMDAAAQGRLTFDRISTDLAAAVRNREAGFQTDNNGKLLEFISSVPSAGIASIDNRGLSIIAYRIAPHADNQSRICLQRGCKAVGWDDRDLMGMKNNGIPIRFTDPEFPSSLIPTSSDFHVLAPGVIRMVVAFQLSPDNLPVALADHTTIPNSTGQITYSPPVRSVVPTNGDPPVELIDRSRIHSLIVGLVTVDLNTVRALSAGELETLAGGFAQPSNDTLPVAGWASLSVGALPASVPLPARQAVRCFQRYFPISNNSSVD